MKQNGMNDKINPDGIFQANQTSTYSTYKLKLNGRNMISAVNIYM